jgi:hypothetical protein
MLKVHLLPQPFLPPHVLALDIHTDTHTHIHTQVCTHTRAHTHIHHAYLSACLVPLPTCILEARDEVVLHGMELLF